MLIVKLVAITCFIKLDCSCLGRRSASFMVKMQPYIKTQLMRTQLWEICFISLRIQKVSTIAY